MSSSNRTHSFAIHLIRLFVSFFISRAFTKTACNLNDVCRASFSLFCGLCHTMCSHYNVSHSSVCFFLCCCSLQERVIRFSITVANSWDFFSSIYQNIRNIIAAILCNMRQLCASTNCQQVGAFLSLSLLRSLVLHVS